MTTQIDSKLIPIAKRYTNALVELAKADNSVEKTFDELKSVMSVIIASPDLSEFLSHPAIPVTDKKDVIQQIFKTELSEKVYNLLYLLIDKNRFNLFHAILATYEKAMDDLIGVARVSVTTAVAMDDNLKQKLKKKLEDKFNKKDIIIDYEIDKSIIAGLVIKMDDNVIDASLLSKFENMKKQLV